MTFPANVEDFRALCGAMRELGAVQAFGVVLGPVPTKLASLERMLAAGQTVDAGEVERERSREKVAEARQGIRDRIGADLSDADCDKYLPLEVRELAKQVAA